jgi:acyl-CoA synthetase (AMP-forming)/AMP-acid ligase II
VGLIEVGGPSVMSGYFRNREASERALHQGFVRTGDLGFFADGDLFVVGRRKETIIKGGRNLYPYDLEAAAGSVPGVRAGRVVAFGVSNAENGTEDIVLVCETKIKDVAERKALARAVKAAVFMATQARIDVLELVDPGVLTKTSSGKLQRSAVRERYQRGALLPQQPVSWLLRAKAAWARIRHRR